MSSSPCPCKDDIRQVALALGASRVGFARAEALPQEEVESYRRWLAEGCHGTMEYLEKYDAIRSDPRQLLPGATTVISLAFNYYLPPRVAAGSIAMYAQGMDYHWVVKERLQRLAEMIPGESRVCVDTAPLRERWWAQRAGVGFIGRSGMLVVPGQGTHFFLGEILTTAEFPPDEPCRVTCGTCRRCVDACPAQAICGDGTIDARRCLSYLTIEHRGDFPPGTDLHGHLYGCDVCADCCPHNRGAVATTIPEFHPREALLAMTDDRWQRLTSGDWRRLTRGSAMSRLSLSGIRRNISFNR
ncbi:MAG: tRNA epoxyqueuosine(34) reductase QueG [Bacteroidales bacterium]|nr:tRNA epoxyqueuosine(34) reductase QueG [Bacteroidales bacterium]